MIFKLSKNETMNNVLNIILIFMAMPVITGLFKSILGVSSAYTAYSKDVANAVGAVLTGSSGNTAKDTAKPIAEDLHEEFYPTTGGLFRTLGSSWGITNVQEDKVVAIFNRCKNEMEAAYVCYWYANLYGKSIKTDINSALNDAEYNSLYLYVRNILNRMK